MGKRKVCLALTMCALSFLGNSCQKTQAPNTTNAASQPNAAEKSPIQKISECLGKMAWEKACQIGGQVQASMNATEQLYQGILRVVPLAKFAQSLTHVDKNQVLKTKEYLQKTFPGKTPPELMAIALGQQCAIVGGAHALACAPLPWLNMGALLADYTLIPKYQQELVLLVAAFHGRDIFDPTVDAEVLAVLGISHGVKELARLGTQAGMKAGNDLITKEVLPLLSRFSGLAQFAPVAGSLVSASTAIAQLVMAEKAAESFYELRKKSEPTAEQIEGIARDLSPLWEQTQTQEVLSQKVVAIIVRKALRSQSKAAVAEALAKLHLSPEWIDTVTGNEDVSPLVKMLNGAFLNTLLQSLRQLEKAYPGAPEIMITEKLVEELTLYRASK